MLRLFASLRGGRTPIHPINRAPVHATRDSLDHKPLHDLAETARQALLKQLEAIQYDWQAGLSDAYSESRKQLKSASLIQLVNSYFQKKNLSTDHIKIAAVASYLTKQIDMYRFMDVMLYTHTKSSYGHVDITCHEFEKNEPFCDALTQGKNIHPNQPLFYLRITIDVRHADRSFLILPNNIKSMYPAHLRFAVENDDLSLSVTCTRTFYTVLLAGGINVDDIVFPGFHAGDATFERQQQLQRMGLRVFSLHLPGEPMTYQPHGYPAKDSVRLWHDLIHIAVCCAIPKPVRDDFLMLSDAILTLSNCKNTAVAMPRSAYKFEDLLIPRLNNNGLDDPISAWQKTIYICDHYIKRELIFLLIYQYFDQFSLRKNVTDYAEMVTLLLHRTPLNEVNRNNLLSIPDYFAKAEGNFMLAWVFASINLREIEHKHPTHVDTIVALLKSGQSSITWTQTDLASLDHNHQFIQELPYFDGRPVDVTFIPYLINRVISSPTLQTVSESGKMRLGQKR